MKLLLNAPWAWGKTVTAADDMERHSINSNCIVICNSNSNCNCNCNFNCNSNSNCV